MTPRRSLVVVARRMASQRAWYEPNLLFPSTNKFRETELNVLTEFTELCASGVDGKMDASRVSTGEEGSRQTIAELLGDFAEEYAPSEEDDVRRALARRYATYTARKMLPAESADLVSRRAGALDEISRIKLPWVSDPVVDEAKFVKLQKALATAASGSPWERLEAQFELEDEDDDGLVDEAAVERIIQAMAIPVGRALADVHDVFVASRLAELGGRWTRRRQKIEARRILSKSYPLYKLDVATKARCVAAWAEKEKTVRTREPAPLFSVDWFMGRGALDLSYVTKEQLAESVKQFFPELADLGRVSADHLRIKRVEWWDAVEENRTTQYALALFCVACGTLDYIIMEA